MPARPTQRRLDFTEKFLQLENSLTSPSALSTQLVAPLNCPTATQYAQILCRLEKKLAKHIGPEEFLQCSSMILLDKQVSLKDQDYIIVLPDLTYIIFMLIKLFPWTCNYKNCLNSRTNRRNGTKLSPHLAALWVCRTQRRLATWKPIWTGRHVFVCLSATRYCR